jgi:hypothetical protein
MSGKALAVFVSTVVLLVCAASARATGYNINWLDLSPASQGIDNPFPFGQEYTLPGYGNVQISHTATPAELHWFRNTIATDQNGTVSNGDTYSWTNKDYLSAGN